MSGFVSLRDADPYDFNGVRDTVVDLSGRGFGTAYIAKKLGVSEKVVRTIRRSEFEDRNANRQQIKEAHSQTVQWLKLKVTERIHSAGEKWDRRDAELLLKVLEREARLYGTDEPTQANVSVTIEDLTDDELTRQLAAEGIVLQVKPPPAPLALPEPVEDAEVHVRSEDPPPPAETGSASCGA